MGKLSLPGNRLSSPSRRVGFGSDAALGPAPVQHSAPWKAWYKTRRWQALRLEVLKRDNYTCQRTGRVLGAKHPDPDSPVVNHRRPHRGDEALFWDIDNLETVSKAVHDAAIQREEHHHLASAGLMLSAFLEDLACQPFVDGAADCVLSVADWIVMRGHPDPAAPYRGRYRTALGRQRLIRKSGGLPVLMSEGAARAGLTETSIPVRGDVGLIVAHGQTVAAICLGERWAIKGDGLVVAPAERLLMAWRV